MTAPGGLSRRGVLVKLGILFNGTVGAILAVPIVRYILSPVIRERMPGYESWLLLGPLAQFPAGAQREETDERNQLIPRQGAPATVAVGSAVE